MATLAFCPSCGRATGLEHRFCAGCGFPVTEPDELVDEAPPLEEEAPAPTDAEVIAEVAHHALDTVAEVVAQHEETERVEAEADAVEAVAEAVEELAEEESEEVVAAEAAGDEETAAEIAAEEEGTPAEVLEAADSEPPAAEPAPRDDQHRAPRRRGAPFRRNTR